MIMREQRLKAQNSEEIRERNEEDSTANQDETGHNVDVEECMAAVEEVDMVEEEESLRLTPIAHLAVGGEEMSL